MIYLRDRALTRQNITKKLLVNKEEENKEFSKSLMEEEKTIIKNNKLFIEYVRQVNELLKLLKKISKKGFVSSFLNKENKNNENDRALLNINIMI